MPEQLGDKLKKFKNPRNSVRGNHRIVSFLFQSIGRFSLEQKVDFFKQTDDNSDNMLMVAIKHYPEAVIPMLDCIEKLQPKLRGEILAQTNNHGENAFAHAAGRDNEIETRLVDLIGDLAEDLQEEIWAQANSSIKQADQISNSFLASIDSLSEESKHSFLLDTNEKGENLLMQFIQNSPRAVEELLEHIDELPTDTRRIIFLQLNDAGDTALTLALQYAPNAVDPLIMRIKRLNIVDTESILYHAVNKSSISNTDAHPDLKIIGVFIDLRQAGTSVFLSGDLNLFKAVMNLHNELDLIFKLYLKSDLSGRQLLQSWKKILNSDSMNILAINPYHDLKELFAEFIRVGQSVVNDDVAAIRSSSRFFNQTVQEDSESEDEEKKDHTLPEMK